MKPSLMRSLCFGLIVLLVLGCATPEGQRAAESIRQGFINLVLSALMIVSGIAQGLAFLPYTRAS